MSELGHIQYMSVDEYLEFEEQSETRHEYVRGRLFAMSGTTNAHSLICGNLFAALHGFLKGSGCRVHMNSLKLRVEAADAFYYPDLMVTCEALQPQSVFANGPRLVIEILSPSTKQIDRREKLVAYTSLSSLKQYVIVYQDRVRVEVHSKVGDNDWNKTILGRPDELRLEASPNKTLAMPATAIYDGLDMPFLVKEEEDEEYESAFFR